MKPSQLFAASFVLVFVVSGCQKGAAPPLHPSLPATQNVESPGQPEQPDGTENAGDNARDADQPNDPGMTLQHDKTLKQEQPSGDKSSQAAPNDGDAEPPQ